MQSKIYLTNKELLAELNRAKSTYCYFVDPEYSNWDAITDDLAIVTPEFLETARAARQKKTKVPAIVEGLIVRVMTNDHIPDGWLHVGRTPKGAQRLPFPAFKHYRVTEGSLVEVGRSHWSGGLENGRFTPLQGRITNRLAKMWMMLAARYANRANFRGYSFKVDMEAAAIMQLVSVGMNFNESKTLNPFAYWTQIVTNIYKREIVAEGKHATVRDDLLIASGQAPSLKRQLADEDAAKLPPASIIRRPPGRPRKIQSVKSRVAIPRRAPLAIAS